MQQQNVCGHCRKADQVFADNDLWKSVPDRDRRDLYDDILHQLEKKEKVRVITLMMIFVMSLQSDC